MLQPTEADSLSSLNDDALFGSGPANWNVPTSPPPGQIANGSSRDVIFNDLYDVTDLHTDGVPGEQEGASEGPEDRIGDRANNVGARPKVNNSERNDQPENGYRDRTRTKTVKDKENKNKNSNIKKPNTPQQNGRVPAVRNSSKDFDWKPTLQYVNYNNANRKNGNSVKQKKQTMNQNSAMVQNTPDDLICANDIEGEGVTDEFLHLPSCIDPNADPSQISQIYVRSNRRPGHAIPPTPLGQSGLELHDFPQIDNENTELKSHTPVKRIHNNLWEGSKNCNVREVPGMSNHANFHLGPFRNDVEMDADNIPLACADLPGLNHQQVNTSLGLDQIVNHFPGNDAQSSRNSLGNSQNLSPSSGESRITVPYNAMNEVTIDNFSVNLDSLRSDLPTDFLYGDGNRDLMLAQQLQMKYDKENADMQIERQYDDVSNFDYMNLSADQRSGLPSRIGNQSPRNGFRGEPVMNDVYDPDALADGFTDSLFVSCNNENTPGLPTVSPDLRYDLPSHLDPSLSPSNSHCPSRRGMSLQDEKYARHLAEEIRLAEDEELARQLQEQDALETRGYGLGNHGNEVLDVNEYRGDSEPLYARFNRTWHRPLTVSASGRSNNVMDSTARGVSSTERPLVRLQPVQSSMFEYLESTHRLPEYQNLPQHYGQYEFNPDYLMDSYGEDLVSISRDPRMLATLLMERDPNMRIPNEIDLNDYEALWELAEGLGEVKRVGMEPAELSALPVHVYQGQASPEDNKTDCLVCLNEFKKGERLRTLPCCHFYHVDCIDEWLKRNAVCPVCRQSATQRQ